MQFSNVSGGISGPISDMTKLRNGIQLPKSFLESQNSQNLLILFMK